MRSATCTAGSTCCEKMHAAIAGHRAANPIAACRIIHLGDYVDRGDNSSGVIELLIETVGRDSAVVALAGNHDLGFVEFLDAPQAGRTVRE